MERGDLRLLMAKMTPNIEKSVSTSSSVLSLIIFILYWPVSFKADFEQCINFVLFSSIKCVLCNIFSRGALLDHSQKSGRWLKKGWEPVTMTINDMFWSPCKKIEVSRWYFYPECSDSGVQRDVVSQWYTFYDAFTRSRTLTRNTICGRTTFQHWCKTKNVLGYWNEIAL